MIRVALLSPVWFPVPPPGYGGIEWIVHLLADGLAEAGVDVTLFASGDSRTTARLESVFAEAPSERIGQTFWELQHVVACLEQAVEGRFDIVHDHSGLLGLALGALAPIPMVHTVHGPLDGDAGELYKSVCRMAPRAHLVSLTQAQRQPKPELPWLATCPNALDLDRYPFNLGNDGYLLFLGRMSAEKGAHRAIEVARAAGMPLRIAGKCREPFELEYFDAYVRPELDESIVYLGEVTHADKVELLQRARATVFPIEWEEPFGLVMIESLACGTPVIATQRGSVPEVLDDGVTGIVVEDYRAMVDALHRVDELDPHVLRRTVKERFAPERMVGDYVAVYERAIELDRR